ncbi:MAG: 4-hydroxy-tetrahydrodipicolinate synthase [Ignavibacteriae bacterium]|nr:4-hydroxy-tetrahydrodipicolinate synthase [Ignavibacteriota bacterium]MCB9215424.1 4-hydroxy-tetrahydrodipicolinate synthase [Ignavibacteria bacterium]
MKRLFEGTGTALATPFKEDGRIDFDSFERLVQYQIDGGIEALVVCGSTGESATMTFDEKVELISRTVELASRVSTNRPQVIAGTGSNVTSETIHLTVEAAGLGVDGVLLVSPYYNKPSQRGIYAHYAAVAEAVPNLPLILYNVPGRTGSNITAATTLKLAREFPNIVAIKEASADLEQCCEIMLHAPDHFLLYSGEDSLTLPLIAMGARGVIAVVSNEVPHEFGEMVRAGLSGHIAKARELHMRLFNLMRLNFIESNPVPVKAALGMMDIFTQVEYREPLVPLSEENEDVLRDELRRLGLVQDVESPMEVSN